MLTTDSPVPFCMAGMPDFAKRKRKQNCCCGVKSVSLENKRIIYGNWEIPLDELLKFTSKSVACGSSKCLALSVVTSVGSVGSVGSRP